MLEFSNEELLHEKSYTDEEIKTAALIVHPSILWRYWLVAEEIVFVFEQWSNFTQLKTPIVDESGNEFWDSEWYYMAQRVADLEIKKLIAFCSWWKYLSKKSAYLHPELLDKDPFNRIKYMRKAIKFKFDNNPHLKQLLLETWEKDIIEYTYWGDIFFGVDCNTKKWANILWKLLVEYRNANR